MNKPNVIFFFADQQRWDTIGAYGQKLDVTPNLDKMAAEGVKFNNAFTCQPVCGPARACLQTGIYATQSGSCTNGVALNPNVPHLADMFNQAGYETAYVGKWHLASGEPNGNDKEKVKCLEYETSAIPKYLRGGYKDWWIASDVLEFTSHGYGGYMHDGDGNKREFDHYRADATTDFALEYLEQKTSDQPFFMMISYIEPHHQNDRETHEGPKGYADRFLDYDIPGDLLGRKGNWKEEYHNYLACCHSLDMNLGRIRDELKRHGLDENTIIFYSSDHGSHFKTRNKEYKRSCHEGCIRVPMLAYGPGFEGGKSIEELVSIIDLPSTFLSVADIEVPESFRGGNLLDLVKAKDQRTEDKMNESDVFVNWPEEVFIQISENHVGRAIRTKRWKYSIWAADKEKAVDIDNEVYEESFLYDLDNDPHERHNLVEEPTFSEVRTMLREKLIEKMVEAGELEPQVILK